MNVTGPFDVGGPGRHAEPRSGSSRATRERSRRPNGRAPTRSLDGSRTARIGGPSASRARTAARRSLRRGARQGRQLRGRHRDGAARHAHEPAVPVPQRAGSGRRRARHASTRSATSSSRRGCRSSSGAAFPTTSCSTLAEQGKLSDPDGYRAQVTPHARGPARELARREFRGSVAVSAQPAEPRSGHRAFPDFDDNLRTAMRRETELLFENVDARGSTDHGAAHGRLHVRERAAREALRHSGRLRQQVPPGEAHRPEPPRPARPGEHADTVTSNPNRTSPVLRGKWVLENMLGAPPPGAARRTCRRSPRTRPARPHARCASGSRSTARTRCAPPATA